MKNYFIGKICSVFTVQTNRNFKEENPATYPQQVYQYFLGLVEAFDQEGVVLQQLNSNRKTYICTHQLVAIAEEEIMDPSDPKDAVVINELKAAASEVKEEAKQAGLIDFEKLQKFRNT